MKSRRVVPSSAVVRPLRALRSPPRDSTTLGAAGPRPGSGRSIQGSIPRLPAATVAASGAHGAGNLEPIRPPSPSAATTRRDYFRCSGGRGGSDSTASRFQLSAIVGRDFTCSPGPPWPGERASGPMTNPRHSAPAHLRVRELLLSEVDIRIDYFHHASTNTSRCSASASTVALRQAWREIYKGLARAIRQRQHFTLAWELDRRIIGFSSLDQIAYGEQAYITLHIITAADRHARWEPSWSSSPRRCISRPCPPTALLPAQRVQRRSQQDTPARRIPLRVHQAPATQRDQLPATHHALGPRSATAITDLTTGSRSALLTVLGPAAGSSRRKRLEVLRDVVGAVPGERLERLGRVIAGEFTKSSRP